MLQPRGVFALAFALTLIAVALTCLEASGLELAGRLVAIVACSAFVLTAARGRERSPGAERIEREEKRIAAETAASSASERTEDATETASGKRTRETYIAAVSHELRTPLNAILGFTQVLLSEIDGPLSPSQREDVTAIHDSGMHLRALVEEVIGESAGSSSAREIRPVAIEPLVRELGRGLEAQLRGRPVTLRLAIDPDLPSPVGDARRLRQILWNLGSNAVRYTERGEIEIRVKVEGDNLRFSVRDTGRGIAQKDLALVVVLIAALAVLARRLRAAASDAASMVALALALGVAAPWPYGLAIVGFGLAGAAWLHVARARVERQPAGVGAHLAGVSAAHPTSELGAAQPVAPRPRPSARPPSGVRARFMAAMGHELRSPLNSISGFAQLLEDGSDGPLNDAQRENVVLVRRAADELITLLTDILDAARIEAGRIRLDRAWTAPVEVLTLALERSRAQSDGEGERASVDAQVQPGLSPLFVDRARLGQAVFNVLRAVVRGRATIHARVREMTEGGRSVVRFELHDRGTPISPADAARAFDPDPAARPQGRSLALGLALSVARDIAQLHGGGARAEPLDGGTNWMLWVPAETEDEPPKRGRAAVPLARGPRRDQR